MIPASKIIEDCGGFKAVADRLGLDRSGVQRWTYDHPKGSGNRIPTQHWAEIIRLAKECGCVLDVQDLAPPDAVEAANQAARPSRQTAA